MSQKSFFVIDVGTSSSAPRGKKLQKIYRCPALFIEPDSEALAKVSVSNGDIKVPAAISCFDGTTDFYMYQDGTHSILQTNLEQIHQYIDGYSGKPAKREDWTCRKKIRVDCFTLHTLVQRYGIDYVPALKVDTQGHDLEVIKSLGTSISKVNRIECEVQITPFEVYKNQSKKTDLVKFLTQHHFKLVESEKQTFDQEENLAFVKNRWLDFYYRRIRTIRKFCNLKATGV